MEKIIPFNIGEIVTLKSHPLLSKVPKKIIEFAAQVPPLMLIKEIYIEKEEKKKTFSEDIENAQIADLIKYSCVYFHANKSEFQEKIIFHSLLESYLKLNYFREIEKDKKVKIELEKQLVPEVLKYEKVFDYKYGDVIQFKTKKLEHRKSYNNVSNEKISSISYQTPDFVLSGIKNEAQTDLFYPDGSPKRKVTKQLFKIIWFNHFQQKFSEYYLPKEFFVKNLKI